jgi:hypothetical protein
LEIIFGIVEGTRFARTLSPPEKSPKKLRTFEKIADIVRNRKIALSLGAVGFNPVFFEFWHTAPMGGS